MSYVPNLSRVKLGSFILHMVIFIAQRPLSHFLFKHCIVV